MLNTKNETSDYLGDPRSGNARELGPPNITKIYIKQFLRQNLNTKASN